MFALMLVQSYFLLHHYWNALFHLLTRNAYVVVQIKRASWTSLPSWPSCTDRCSRKTPRRRSWRPCAWRTSRRKATSWRQSSVPNSQAWERSWLIKKVQRKRVSVLFTACLKGNPLLKVQFCVEEVHSAGSTMVSDQRFHGFPIFSLLSLQWTSCLKRPTSDLTALFTMRSLPGWSLCLLLTTEGPNRKCLLCVYQVLHVSFVSLFCFVSSS